MMRATARPRPARRRSGSAGGETCAALGRSVEERGFFGGCGRRRRCPLISVFNGLSNTRPGPPFFPHYEPRTLFALIYLTKEDSMPHRQGRQGGAGLRRAKAAPSLRRGEPSCLRAVERSARAVLAESGRLSHSPEWVIEQVAQDIAERFRRETGA